MIINSSYYEYLHVFRRRYAAFHADDAPPADFGRLSDSVAWSKAPWERPIEGDIVRVAAVTVVGRVERLVRLFGSAIPTALLELAAIREERTQLVRSRLASTILKKWCVLSVWLF